MAHVKWEFKYHVVFILKYRIKVFYDKLRKRAGEIFQQLCKHKRLKLLEGHAMPDHVPMCLSIPPKYSVSMVIGYINGEGVIRVHREFMGCKKPFTGTIFGLPAIIFTIGLDEQQIRELETTKSKLNASNAAN